MDLRHIEPDDAKGLIQSLADWLRSSSTVEEASRLLCREMYEGCGAHAEGERGRQLVLSRMFLALPLERLDPPARAAALALSADRERPPARYLVLVGSQGVEPAWRDRRLSRGHGAIPLDLQTLTNVPMIARCCQQIGFDEDQLLAAPPGMDVEAVPQSFGVFHVQDARGSPYVPDQGFVRTYGIGSVVGCGSMLPNRAVSLWIGFARVTIESAPAPLLSLLAHFWRHVHRAYLGERILSMRPDELLVALRGGSLCWAVLGPDGRLAAISRRFAAVADRGPGAMAPAWCLQPPGEHRVIVGEREAMLHVTACAGERLVELDMADRSADLARFWDQHTELAAAYADESVRKRALAAALAAADDAAQRLRSVVDGVIDGLVTIDERGIVESFNPAAERQFLWLAGEIIGRNVNLLMPEPYHGEHDGYLEGYLRTGVPHVIGIGRTVTGLRRDGSTFPMDLAVSEVTVGSRRLFLGIIRDVTERRQAEETRQGLLAREALERGRVEMASGILHDVGNALTGIGSRAVDTRDALDRSDAGPRMEKLAGFLRQHAGALDAALGSEKARAVVELADALGRNATETRARGLESLEKLLGFVLHVQEVLSAYRGYSGVGAGPTREQVEVAKLLLDAQTMLSDAVTKRGGALDLRCQKRLPPVRAERGKLMQVLINLVRNAVEAHDASPGLPLTVTLAASAEGGAVVIEVRDTGPGFDEDVAARLFVEGFSTKQRGSGLGLRASRRILESLGGSLTLRSDGSGRGAVARMQLPITE